MDPSFSTALDYLFAKFIAFDRLKAWLLEKISVLRGGDCFGCSVAGHGGGGVALAELGYGLFHTGQLNDGAAGVGLIFRWLEDKFRVSIGIPAKRFMELRSRKRLSRTRFLDEMILAILKKMDQEDGLPGQHKGIKGED
ncbi:RteC domain-containing protein [Pedobacter sp. LMG 31643]|nr:RteC domain-containing protein [Pedobacter foliorum]